jgi:hypothetical protein
MRFWRIQMAAAAKNRQPPLYCCAGCHCMIAFMDMLLILPGAFRGGFSSFLSAFPFAQRLRYCPFVPCAHF